MDKYKIENFQKANPGRDFPKFVTLTPTECEGVRNRLAEVLGLQGEPDLMELVKSLHAQIRSDLGEVPEQGPPDLRRLLGRLSIGHPHRVLVNWYRFDDIDGFDLDDLARHFDDIWYPGPDDIEVFDESCSWFLCISHDGHVTLIQP